MSNNEHSNDDGNGETENSETKENPEGKEAECYQAIIDLRAEHNKVFNAISKLGKDMDKLHKAFLSKGRK